MAVDVHIWGTISPDAQPSWSEQKWQCCQIWQVTWAVPNLEPLKLQQGWNRVKDMWNEKGSLCLGNHCQLIGAHKRTVINVNAKFVVVCKWKKILLLNAKFGRFDNAGYDFPKGSTLHTVSSSLSICQIFDQLEDTCTSSHIYECSWLKPVQSVLGRTPYDTFPGSAYWGWRENNGRTFKSWRVEKS